MGDSINMAARLMCLKEAKGTVLCDDRSFKICSNHFNFEFVGLRVVKGKAKEIKVFKPKSTMINNQDLKDNSQAEASIIGRQREKRTIDQTLNGFVDGNGRVIIIEGDRGQGVTTLATYAKNKSTALSLMTW